jgi:N-acetylglucosamine-6-phosphate deacetylase
MIRALTNATIFTGSEEIKDKAILIENGKIKALVNASSIPQKAEITDHSGNYIAPGLLDLQIYGGGGYLFSNKTSAEALKSIAYTGYQLHGSFQRSHSCCKKQSACGFAGFTFGRPLY